MKKFYFLFLTFISFYFSFSAPVIKAVSNGSWSSASTWDLNRIPQVGDTIIISSNETVIINDDQNFNGFVYLKIYGGLGFQNNNSTLSVGNTSLIIVYSSGEILGGGSASQKIRMNGTVIFQGNDAPVYGPQMASATSNGFSAFSSSPLPVKFVGFTLTNNKNNNVLVQWATTEEVNADMYQLQRSDNGTNWNTVAYVAAANNSSVNNYSFTDKNISSKIVYYRIKEIDLGGKSTYTPVKSIKTETISSANDIKIASVQNKVLLQFSQEIRGSMTVRFITQSGQIIDQQTIINPVGQIVLNSKVTGNYIISLSNGQDINAAKQVIL